MSHTEATRLPVGATDTHTLRRPDFVTGCGLEGSGEIRGVGLPRAARTNAYRSCMGRHCAVVHQVAKQGERRLLDVTLK